MTLLYVMAHLVVFYGLPTMLIVRRRFMLGAVSSIIGWAISLGLTRTLPLPDACTQALQLEAVLVFVFLLLAVFED